MSDLSKKVLGIDLGTTYSCMAYVDEHGKPVVVKNSEGESITPSVVFFDSNEVIVGGVAKENALLHSDNAISFVKRNMGKPNVEYFNHGVTRKPEEISSCILKKLVTDAEQSLGETIKDVVITCPAYFGINEREATRIAGEIAGLNVLHVINEPTAAAIAYGMADTTEQKVVLIYDLGGGTFDVTLIKLTPDAIEVICTGGDHELGGKDWDDCIVRYAAHYFQEETNCSDNILDDQETLQELQNQAERAKKNLTKMTKAPMKISHGGDSVKLELTREKFEEITADLIQRTLDKTKQMLDDAKLKNHHTFDELLLVGGSTRMPQVLNLLKQEFPDKEPKIFDPDEAVAKGAAIFGWKTLIDDELKRRIEHVIKETGEQSNSFTLAAVKEKVAQELANETGFTLAAIKSHKKIINVSSKSFGVVVQTPNGEKVSNLVLRNQQVPIEITGEFGTSEDNQDNVRILIMENEMNEKVVEVSDTKEIGEAILSDLPQGLPMHSPIVITFKLNAEGRLEVTGIDKTSGRSIQTEIQTTSVIPQEEKEEAIKRMENVTW